MYLKSNHSISLTNWQQTWLWVCRAAHTHTLDLWQWEKDKEKEKDVTDVLLIWLFLWSLQQSNRSKHNRFELLYASLTISNGSGCSNRKHSLHVSMQVWKSKLKTPEKAFVPRLCPAQGLILTRGRMLSSLSFHFPSLICLIKQLKRQDINR